MVRFPRPAVVLFGPFPLVRTVPLIVLLMLAKAGQGWSRLDKAGFGWRRLDAAGHGWNQAADAHAPSSDRFSRG